MKKIIFQAVCLCLTVLSAGAYDNAKTIGSKLETVTVFRNGAKMIHTAKARLQAGNNELLIDGISNTIDINSLQINCPAAVTILGVQFNNQYMVGENKSVAERKLQDSLQLLQHDMQQLDLQIAINEDLLTVLRSNKEIKGVNTGLSVAELMKMMDYYKQKSTSLQTDIAKLKLSKQELNQVMYRINQQIREEQKRNTQSAGRVELQLSAAYASDFEFTVSYITPNAFWTSYYDIRIDNIKTPMKLQHKAKISQTTGLDWKKVKLSLSSNNFRNYGSAPILTSWFLSFIDPIRTLNADLSRMNTIPGVASKQELEEVVVTGYSSSAVALRGASSGSGSNDPMYIVNGAEMSPYDYSKINPSAIKDIQVLKAKDATALYGSRASNGVIIVNLKTGLEDYVTVSENELDLTYDIELPYDVPTNGKPQIASLKEDQLTANYKFYAVPKLDKEVFLLAEIADWEKLNLMPGEANIIFEGTYVGKSFIAPNQTNDTMNLTLGKDSRVAIKREKLTDFSSTKFLGSNKLQTVTYEITVKNNKKDPIHCIVKDQYPISTHKDIEVDLKESSGASINEEIGVLTWQLNLAPGETKKLRMSYGVKYPKSKAVRL